MSAYANAIGNAQCKRTLSVNLTPLQIYYADKQANRISKMDFDGTNVNKLYNDWHGGTEGIALDWVGK